MVGRWVLLVALVLGGCASAHAIAPRVTARALPPTTFPAPPTTASPTTTTTMAPHRSAAAAARPSSRPVIASAAPPAPAGRVINAPALTQTASLRGDTTRYAYPAGPVTGTIPGSWYGYQSILPVIDQTPGWVEVRVAQRPNGDVAWVRAHDVDLTPDAYYLALDLPSRHLMVFQSGQLVGSFPAGIGTTDDPTPTGPFFVAFRAPPPDPGYGPFVLVTSAHSDAIDNWEGFGDAVTGIHGPITASADQQIGTNGARISHGCVRLHDWDLQRLLMIPPGTQLDILG